MNRQGSAWNSNFDGMAEKTVLKHLLSRLHLPTVDTLITIDDQTEQAQEPERNVTPEKGTDADALSEKLAEKAAETAEADAQVAEPSDAELAEESAKGLF
jgi:recombinational DNA repair protein RecT